MIVANAYWHAVLQKNGLMDPTRQHHSIPSSGSRRRDLIIHDLNHEDKAKKEWTNIPSGAEGKLSIQTNIEGNQPFGSQNTGFDLYHQTKNICDPVVVIHKKDENLVLNPFCADASVVSRRSVRS